MTCRECGCSDLRACVDAETGERCRWVLPDLCSFCAEYQAFVAELIWQEIYVPASLMGWP